MLIFTKTSLAMKKDSQQNSIQQAVSVLISDTTKKQKLIEIIKRKGIARSKIFLNFIDKNNINGIAFRFLFIDQSTLKRNYPETKGFSPNFSHDASEGRVSKKDRAALLKYFRSIYKSTFDRFYEQTRYSPANKTALICIGPTMLPKVLEFVSNDQEILNELGIHEITKHHRGVFFISALIDESNRTPWLERPIEEPKFSFAGNNQELIDLIAEEGVFHSNKYKKFIKNHNTNDLRFKFSFVSKDDLKRIADLEFQSNFSEKFLTKTKTPLGTEEDHSIFFKVVNFQYNPYFNISDHITEANAEERISQKSFPPLEILSKNEHTTRILFGDRIQEPETKEGLYFIFPGLSDSTETKKLAFLFENNKNDLIQIISHEGISGSEILRKLILENDLEDIEFRYDFLPLEVLHRMFQPEEDYGPNFVQNIVAGPPYFSSETHQSLLKALYSEYYFIQIQERSKNPPLFMELLNKNSPLLEDLLPTQGRDTNLPGLYLISASILHHAESRIFLPALPEGFTPTKRAPKWIKKIYSEK
jgi:hypothetical protein